MSDNDKTLDQPFTLEQYEAWRKPKAADLGFSVPIYVEPSHIELKDPVYKAIWNIIKDWEMPKAEYPHGASSNDVINLIFAIDQARSVPTINVRNNVPGVHVTTNRPLGGEIEVWISRSTAERRRL